MASIIISSNDPVRSFTLLTTRALGQKPWLPKARTLGRRPLSHKSWLPPVQSGLACKEQQARRGVITVAGHLIWIRIRTLLLSQSG